MFGVKVLLGTATLCSALLAVLMLWNEEVLSCGYYTTKCLITVFVISTIVLTRETAQLWLTTGIHKSYKRKFSIVRKSSMITMMWRMNIWSIFGIKNVVCCSFRLSRWYVSVTSISCDANIIILCKSIVQTIAHLITTSLW